MTEEKSALSRSVDWKQGMFIALGVPLLILPSIGDISSLVWGLCIVVWVVSVLQGFVQNLAYAELITSFPESTGIPGCAQTVFASNGSASAGIDKAKLIGAFSAWCYWFAWCPVVAIFTMMIGDQISLMFDLDIAGWAAVGYYTIIGIVIVVSMYILSAKGLEGGATVGTILALISMIPIVIILIGGLAAGMFEFSNITGQFTGPNWSWSAVDVIVLLGCFGLAQWSACAWETAAIYGPEYKDPGKDTPKALFSCGLICLAMYFFVSFVVYGSLGYWGIDAAGTATLKPIAETAFGDIGGMIALILLIIAMVLIIQTGFLGSSRTLYSMAGEKNLPKWFLKTNDKGMPTNCFLFVCIFNVFLVVLIEACNNPLNLEAGSMTVLTASAMGYAIANGIALLAFVITRRNARFANIERPFKAPKPWTYVIAFMVFMQFCVFFPCLMYWSYTLTGNVLAIVLGLIIILAFLPIWYTIQKKEMA